MNGVAVALITPFCRHEVDYASLAGLMRYLDAYCDAYVVLGTTGEPYTLSADEKDAVVRFVLQRRGQKRVIVGVEGNDTALSCANAAHWQEMGADALLCITPYCNRCTQEGLYWHYRTLSQSVRIPIIVYNVPSRTGVNVLPSTLERLAGLDHIEGIKEASGNPDQIAAYATVCRKHDLALYCGDDALSPLFRVLGADAVISAAANAVPHVVRQGWNAPLDALADWNVRYKPLFGAMFATVNPIGVKYACAYRRLCRNELRLPLTSIVEDQALLQLLYQFPRRDAFFIAK